MRGLHFFYDINQEEGTNLTKTFLTYQQQLQILEHNKQLAIPNPNYATKMLEEISYYSLIVGYKSLFKHKASDKYLRGVTFDEFCPHPPLMHDLYNIPNISISPSMKPHARPMIIRFFMNRKSPAIWCISS